MDIATNLLAGAAALLLCTATGCFEDQDPRGDEDEGSSGMETGEDTADASASDNPETTAGTGQDSGSDGTTGSDDDPGSTGDEDDPAQGDARYAQLDVDGVESLPGGFHYELWAIIDAAPITVGKFNIDASGAIVDLDGIAIPDAVFDAGRDLSVATEVVVTIEGPGDEDIVPGASKYLAGPLDGDAADMDPFDDIALGFSPEDIGGAYILATPTNGPDTSERSGVWFLNLATDPPEPGLALPELPDGWLYEGWAVIDGSPVTTGRFAHADEPDMDAPFSGESPGPNVPGEDFLVAAPEGLDFPTDLRGTTIVLTIEPEPDSSPLPFTFKPLVGVVRDDAADHHAFDMDNNTDTFPTATVTLVHPSE